MSLTFIISTPKLVLSIRIVLSSFYLLIFYFEKFSTWVRRLPFGLYVKLKLSTARLKYFQKCYRIWTCIAVNQTTFFTAFRAFSLTRPAATQLYWNKRKFLHRKNLQLSQYYFGTPTWPPFHCFGTPKWPPWRHVKTLYKLASRQYLSLFKIQLVINYNWGNKSASYSRNLNLKFSSGKQTLQGKNQRGIKATISSNRSPFVHHSFHAEGTAGAKRLFSIHS